MDKFEEAYESYKQQGTPQANQSDSAAGKEEIIAVSDPSFSP